jgi:uncharacterized membrane protein YhhN
MNFAKETFRRLVLQTPSYFKKLIYFGLTLGAVGAGLIAVPELEKFHSLGQHLVIIGLVCSVIAKTAVKDTNQI